MANPAQQNRFKVQIDALSLGYFSKVDGLKATYDIKTYEEGGQNGFVHNLPGRVKFENLTLQRPVDESSKEVALWFASFQGMVKRSSGVISACDSAGDVIHSWSLTGIIPVSWSAAGLDINANGVLLETLVLSHEGFLDAGLALASAL